MRLKRSQIRIALALLLLIPLGFMMIKDDQTTYRSDNNVTVTSGVDYFIKSAHAQSFSSEGQLTQTLTIEELNHFPTKAHSELIKPEMTQFDHDGSTLTAKSLSGKMFDKDDRLQLDENVKVEHNLMNGDTSVLTTSTLTLFKSSKIAETEAPVTISSRESITHADGIRVDFKARTTELSANVKGIYHVDK